MKAPRTKLSSAETRRFLDRLQCHGLMLGHRFREGMRLPLQRFVAKLPVGLSIEICEAANFHGQLSVTISSQFSDRHDYSGRGLTNRLAPIRISTA